MLGWAVQKLERWVWSSKSLISGIFNGSSVSLVDALTALAFRLALTSLAPLTPKMPLTLLTEPA